MPKLVIASVLGALTLVFTSGAGAAPSELDPSFGGTGFALTQFSSESVAEPSHARASGVGVQRDGKIVAAGTFNDQFGNNGGFAIARYGSDGVLDSEFGSGGKVVTGFPGFGYVRGQALALLPDGRIVVGGSALSYATGEVFALARYTPDGSLDPTFGNEGRVAAWLGTYSLSGVTAVAYQSDGKLVAAGTFQVLGGNAVGVARYNPDGSLDTTFGADGLALVSSFYYWEAPNARALLVQPDGRILVTAGLQSAEVTLIRLNGDGSLDPTFGSGGIARPRYGQPYAIALQPDGKIIEAGQGPGGFSLVVARVNADGTPDTSFAGDGAAEIDFLRFDPVAVNAAALSVQVQVNGKIVAAGVGYGNSSYLALARLNPDGTPDAAFGSSGRLLALAPGATGTQASALALQADGRIVVAGHASLANGNIVFALARYTGDPSDTTPPVLALPAEVGADATSPAGASVDYADSVSASDDTDGSVIPVCLPASSTVFAIGDTLVTCTATDSAGNTADGAFTVHVRDAGEQLENLVALVASFDLERLGTSLQDKLATAQRHLSAGRDKQAAESLSAFVAQVNAQRGKELSDAQAQSLRDAALRIIGVIDA